MAFFLRYADTGVGNGEFYEIAACLFLQIDAPRLYSGEVEYVVDEGTGC